MNKHAQELGKLNKGRKKTLSLEDRHRKAKILAISRLKRWPKKTSLDFGEK